MCLQMKFCKPDKDTSITPEGGSAFRSLSVMLT